MNFCGKVLSSSIYSKLSPFEYKGELSLAASCYSNPVFAAMTFVSFFQELKKLVCNRLITFLGYQTVSCFYNRVKKYFTTNKKYYKILALFS